MGIPGTRRETMLRPWRDQIGLGIESLCPMRRTMRACRPIDRRFHYRPSAPTVMTYGSLPASRRCRVAVRLIPEPRRHDSPGAHAISTRPTSGLRGMNRLAGAPIERLMTPDVGRRCCARGPTRCPATNRRRFRPASGVWPSTRTSTMPACGRCPRLAAVRLPSGDIPANMRPMPATGRS